LRKKEIIFYPFVDTAFAPLAGQFPTSEDVGACKNLQVRYSLPTLGWWEHMAILPGSLSGRAILPDAKNNSWDVLYAYQVKKQAFGRRVGAAKKKEKWLASNDRSSRPACDSKEEGRRPPLRSEINARKIGLDTHGLLKVELTYPRPEVRPNRPVSFDNSFSIDSRRCKPCHSFVGCLSFAALWRY
jgi:hypothetical protein